MLITVRPTVRHTTTRHLSNTTKSVTSRRVTRDVTYVTRRRVASVSDRRWLRVDGEWNRVCP